MARKKLEPTLPAGAQLFSDLPVTDPEGLAFEFDGLARTLAELVRNPKNRTPFTVVVRGDWGRGKTTLLHQTKWLLNEKPADGARDVRTLWFNAWKYPGEETILAGLLGEMLQQLRTGTLADQLKLLIDQHKGHLGKAILRIAAPWLGDLAAEAGRFAPAEERRAFYDSFRSLFAETWYLWQTATASVSDTGHMDVEGELRKRQGKAVLAIFLDDLDRCREERVMEVLEAINLFLDLPGVCFFLGLDWGRLTELLKDRMPGREEAFLEKIVQVSLDLPEISQSGVEKYVRTLVEGSSLADVLLGGEDDDIAALAGALNSNHPRHVKRVLNDLSMGLSVLRNTGHLGDGTNQVPERAVVAWHLLHETLPGSEWREVRALRANLRSFLGRWKALGGAKEGQEEQVAGMSKEVVRVYQRGAIGSHMDQLAALDDQRLDLLVHLGSPPRAEVVREFRVMPDGNLEDLAGYAWVEVPAGRFQMGARDFEDARVHAVELSLFKMSRLPITNSQYQRFVDDTRKPAPRHWTEGRIPEGKERHPVVYVSWTDAEAYCAWLSKRMISQGGVVLLPTEAQWEFAARGEEGGPYPWGPGEPTPERANYDMKVGDSTPVGSYPTGATPLGIHDLAGNVWEWCRDWYGPYVENAVTDPPGPKKGTSRVLRGGSFFNEARRLRSAARYHDLPELTYHNIGFRVVWVLA